MMELNLEKLETVGPYAFYQCINISKINLPNLKSIQEGGFEGCSGI
jgi:hypothetical protein